MEVRCDGFSKCLIVGGYLILDHDNLGLCISLKPKVSCYAKLIEESQCFYVEVQTSPGNHHFITTPNNFSNMHNYERFITSVCYVMFSKRDLSMLKAVALTITGDQEFYSESGKTGLGSSAATTVAVARALLKLYDGNSDDEKVFRVASVAHCLAQGNLGSCFDISCAIWGTQIFRRPSVHYLKLEQLWKTEIWDNEHIPCSLPEALTLYVLQTGFEGTSTPMMIKRFQDKAQDDPHTIITLKEVSNECIQSILKKDLEKISKTFRCLRRVLRDITVKWNLPIVPDEVNSLADKLDEMPNVIATIIPGSGGYDSIASRLIPAEEIVTRILFDFESVLPKELPESLYEDCENTLLDLLFVNSGVLSLQCSVRIANCLIILYKTYSPPKLWNLFAVVTKRTTVTGMLVIGQVLDKIGDKSKAMIPGLVKILVNESDLFASLFAIEVCFRKDGEELKTYCNKVFAMSRRALASEDEVLQLIAIRTLEQVFELGVLPDRKCEQEMLEIVSSQSYDRFVIDEACKMIAKWALKPLEPLQNRTKVPESEWQVKGKENKENEQRAFNEVFEFLSNYDREFGPIFQHFLNLVKPEFLCENIAIVFRFIRQKSPSHIESLLSLFGRDVRRELFDEIAKEPLSIAQQQLLKTLAYDHETVEEVAAVSLQLISGSSGIGRLNGASFFAHLASCDFEASLHYLQMAVLYLARPPEDNPSFETDMRGMALIASHIIGAAPDKATAISKVSDDLRVFLSRAPALPNIFSAEYSGIFMLLTVLPKDFVDQQSLTTALQPFIAHLQSLSKRSDVKHVSTKQLTCYVMSFLASHPYMACCKSILDLFIGIPYIQSHTAVLSAMLAAIAIHQVSDLHDTVLVPRIMSLAVPEQYVLSKISAPISEILSPSKFVLPTVESIYFKVSDQYFACRFLQCYPNIILSMEEGTVERVVSKLVSGSFMAHCLLMFLLKTPATQMYCPSDLHKVLLSLLSSTKDISTLHLQVICECVAIWCNLSSEAMAETIEAVHGQKSVDKALLYNALFSQAIPGPVSTMQILGELNEMAKIPSTCPYALFAISTVLKACAMSMTAWGIGDMELSLVLSVMHNRTLLSVVNLYNLSLVFERLLAIIAPDMQHKGVRTTVTLIVNAFRETRIPYADLVEFRTYQPVFAFAKGVINAHSLTFPKEAGTPLYIQMAACAAFSDMLKLCRTSDLELFDLVPMLLVLLQKTESEKVSDLITTIALQFASCSDHDPAQVTTWVSIIKGVLSGGCLPDLQIESSMQVKAVCAEVGQILVPVIANTNPFLGECLDDLVTAATRAIEAGIVKASYAFFCLVLDLFQSRKTDNDLPLLELYDSQFAIAVRNAFKNLEYSGEFLFKYLKFHEKHLREQPQNFVNVANAYITGITSCLDKSHWYYTISSQICDFARESSFFYEKLQGNFDKLEAEFSKVMKNAETIFSTEPPDHVQISVFHASTQNYYKNVVVCYVWLNGMKSIRAQEIMDFLSRELKATEQWRITAAIEGLTVYFTYFSEDVVSSSILSGFLSTFRNLYDDRFDSMKDSFPVFLRMVSSRHIPVESPLWAQLFSMCLDLCFDYTTLAYLLNANPPGDASNLTVKRIFENGEYNDQAMALLTILIPNAWEDELNLLLTSPNINNKFRLTLLSRILKRCSRDSLDSMPLIADVYYRLFKHGGLSEFAQLIITRPELSYNIMAQGLCQNICSLCTSDGQNCGTFVRFLRLFLVQCGSNCSDAIKQIVTETAMKCIINFGQRPQNGRDIRDQSLKLIRSSDCVKQSFMALNDREKQLLVQITETHITRSHPTINLNGVSERKAMNSSDDEWELL